MEKEFIPYEQALVLKELGFDEEVLKVYDINLSESELYNYGEVLTGDDELYAPTYSQAFRFFREKYNIDVISRPHIEKSKKYVCDPVNFKLEAKNTLEEAELECLKKLIEIVKTNEQ